MGNLHFSSNNDGASSKKSAEALTPPKVKSIEPAFDPRSPSGSISRTPIQLEVTPPNHRRMVQQIDTPGSCKDVSENNVPQPRSPLKLIDPESPKNYLRYKQVKGLHRQMLRNGYDPVRLNNSTKK